MKRLLGKFNDKSIEYFLSKCTIAIIGIHIHIKGLSFLPFASHSSQGLHSLIIADSLLFHALLHFPKRLFSSHKKKC